MGENDTLGVAEEEGLLEEELVPVLEGVAVCEAVRVLVRDWERLRVRDDEGLFWLGVGVCTGNHEKRTSGEFNMRAKLA